MTQSLIIMAYYYQLSSLYGFFLPYIQQQKSTGPVNWSSLKVGNGDGVELVFVELVLESLGCTRMSIEELVSWVITYLGDLQPTYIGVII